jgi:thiol peroxidase
MELETVTMHGNPLKLTGALPKKGSSAPDFTAVDQDLNSVNFFSFNKGKVVLLSSVPSLDTSVCSTETKKISQEIEKFGDQILALTISMDLPFAQKRWCGQENVKNIKVLSDYQKRDFGQKYGVLIQGLSLLARTVFVIDANGKIQDVHLVKEITHEPDYKHILREIQQLVSVKR